MPSERDVTLFAGTAPPRRIPVFAVDPKQASIAHRQIRTTRGTRKIGEDRTVGKSTPRSWKTNPSTPPSGLAVPSSTTPPQLRERRLGSHPFSRHEHQSVLNASSIRRLSFFFLFLHLPLSVFPLILQKYVFSTTNTIPIPLQLRVVLLTGQLFPPQACFWNQ